MKLRGTVGRALRRGLARFFLVLALGVAVPGAARAGAYLDDWHPYQTYWAVDWNLAVPLDELRAGYVTNPGWLGGGFAIRVGVVGRLALGVDGSWNFFEQTFPFLTVEQSDFTFTGPVYRTLTSFTALGTAHYYLTQTGVQPFVGVGVGGVWLGSQRRIVNQSSTVYTSGLAFTGEAGLLFNVAPRLGLTLSGRYQMNLTTVPGVKNPQWVSALAGVAYYY